MSIRILSSKNDIIIGEGSTESGIVWDYDWLYLNKIETKRKTLETHLSDNIDCHYKM